MVTESIRYTTARRIHDGEELCIYYGQKLWFDPVDAESASTSEEKDDGWGGLSRLDDGGAEEFDEELQQLLNGNASDVIPEDQLPFSRIKLLPDDEEEDEFSVVRTGMISTTSL